MNRICYTRSDKGSTKDYANAYDKDGVYVGKVERNDDGYSIGTYFGNVRKKKI